MEEVEAVLDWIWYYPEFAGKITGDVVGITNFTNEKFTYKVPYEIFVTTFPLNFMAGIVTRILVMVLSTLNMDIYKHSFYTPIIA